jgi:hypothetical protein
MAPVGAEKARVRLYLMMASGLVTSGHGHINLLVLIAD